MRLSVYRFVLIAMLIGLSGFAAAQSSNWSSADQQFAQEASQGNSAEIDLAQLAEKRASSLDVKDFARKLESDHRAAEQKLQQMGAKSNLSLAATLDPSSQSSKDQLSRMSGSQFDQAFIQHQIEDHQKDIQTFQKESQEGQNPELKSYAATLLPQLQDHLRIAQELQQKVGTSSGSSR